MKNFVLWLFAIAALTVLSFHTLPSPQSLPCPSPSGEESYTAGDFDQLRIRKTYHLSPLDNPRNIPTGSFERYGRTYDCLEVTKEEIDGEIVYAAVFGDASTPYWEAKE